MGYADEPISVSYRFEKTCRFGHRMYKVYDPTLVDSWLELNSLGYEVEFEPGGNNIWLELKSTQACISLAALLEMAIAKLQILKPDIGECSILYGASGLDEVMSISRGEIRLDGYKSRNSNIAFRQGSLEHGILIMLLEILVKVAPKWKEKSKAEHEEEFERAKLLFDEELEKFEEKGVDQNESVFA
jgi:hypothetical protein